VADDLLLVAGASPQGDAPFEQHPPARRRSALYEEDVSLGEADLFAGVEELTELSVVEALEEEEPAQLVDVHQTVAR
jgi:hypothetical protein